MGICCAGGDQNAVLVGTRSRHGSRAMQRLWQQVASGSLRPNGVGLYDTSGNAAEWVEDCWNDFYRMRAEGRIAPDMVSAGQGASSPTTRDGIRTRTSQARQATKLHFGSSRTRIKLL
jgi:formylglycine-generating enzyme required for sulfatase activity